jgi:16S rRNA (guanine966-N2)-methyltransferase
MRIISGIHKGYHISAPINLPARPTTDYCKESLFNILSSRFDFQNLTVLDLYAGTGNISFEFASRECNKVIAVDQNFNCCTFMKQIQHRLQLTNLEIVKSDTLRYMATAHHCFNIIFADPPYDFKNYLELISASFLPGLLSKDGWLILEHSSQTDFKIHPLLFDTRIYGQTRISFFTHAPVKII